MAEKIMRPPTFADLALAHSSTTTADRRMKPYVVVFVGVRILGIVAIVLSATNALGSAMLSASATGGSARSGANDVLMIAGLIGAGTGFVALVVCVIVGLVARGRVSSMAKQTELADLPVNDLFEGDVLGSWTVVESSADSLHVTLPGTQFQALAKRFGALALAACLFIGSGTAIYAAATATSTPSNASTSASSAGGSTPKSAKKSSKTRTSFAWVKGLFWALAGGFWLARWSLKPVAFQWLLASGDPKPSLEIHRLRLFRPTDIEAIPAHSISGFALVDQRLSLHHGNESIELASVSPGPVGRWHAACVATAIMTRLDPSARVPLAISGKSHAKPHTLVVPSAIAEHCPFAVTTVRQALPELTPPAVSTPT